MKKRSFEILKAYINPSILVSFIVLWSTKLVIKEGWIISYLTVEFLLFYFLIVRLFSN